jgi:methyltransferase (TIGR00027 family)
MKDGKPSITAIGTAIDRAVHQVLDDDPKILHDPIALQIVKGLVRENFAMYWPQRYAIASPSVLASSRQDIIEATEELRKPMWVLIRSQVTARSRFTEDCLTEAVAAGVRQYIVLGAGLDTFAYRQPPWAKDLRIFEVDHQATQQWKRNHLAQVGISLPDNLEFCPIDFEQTALAEGLAATSFDRHVPTFISWLGVTMYLTRDAVEATLRFVLSLPRRSEIVFDFSPPRASLSAADAKAWAEVAAFLGPLLAVHGEPMITSFEAEELQGWLRQLGFAKLLLLSSELATERYFAGRRDGLRLLQTPRLLRATV